MRQFLLSRPLKISLEAITAAEYCETPNNIINKSLQENKALDLGGGGGNFAKIPHTANGTKE